jgi:hypothetical protein
MKNMRNYFVQRSKEIWLTEKKSHGIRAFGAKISKDKIIDNN